MALISELDIIHDITTTATIKPQQSQSEKGNRGNTVRDSGKGMSMQALHRAVGSGICKADVVL